MSGSKKLINQRIEEYKANPILPLELSLIQEQLQDPNASVESFKTQYQRDPIFCAALVSLAWQATKNKDNHPIAADHAMSTVGIGGANQHFGKLNKRNASSLSDEVRFLFSSSFLAAELAKTISGKTHLYWTSLFHQLPDIFLWHMQPETMWRVHHKTTHSPKKIRSFEEAKLGFNLAEWRVAVAQQLHMSELNCLTYQKPRPNSPIELIQYLTAGISDDTPTLKRWHKTECWTIFVCNWLAKSLLLPSLANSGKHARLIAQMAFGINHKRLSHIIGECLAITSQHLIGSKLYIPAVNAIWQRSNPHYPQWLITPDDEAITPNAFNQYGSTKAQSETETKIRKVKPKLSAIKPSSVKPSATNSSSNPVSGLINKLEKHPTKFENSIQMLSQTLTAIIEKLGFDRASLLSIEWNGKFAATKMALASNGNKKIRPDFSFKPTPAMTVSPLQKFTEQQGGLLFSKEKHIKIWPKLPQAIQKEKIEQFFFYSIKPAKKVKILIYVDTQEKNNFEPQKTKQLKTLLNALNTGLTTRENLARKTG
mgnify:CR=1 FL=1